MRDTEKRGVPKLSLRLFGAPQLEIDGRLARLGRRKAMALLAYLTVTRSRHHRETLATLLWPESGPEAAFSALRNILWILRQTPLARLLRTDRSTIELEEDPAFQVDVLRFRDLMVGCPSSEHSRTVACDRCAPALAEAVTQAGAPFMEGFLVAGAEGFDDWQFAEREALRRELTEALERLTAFHHDAGAWDLMGTYAQRWLQVDRLSEPAARRWMVALAAGGKRTEALRFYESFRQTLEQELGLTPDSQTEEIVDRVRRSDAGPAPHPASPRRSNLPAALTPFVGREQEVERVERLLESGETRLVTLVGLGGVGKTTLALEVGRRIEDRMDDGVFFVPLGGVDEFDGARSAMAEAVGLRHARGEGEQLALLLEDYLAEREAVLILDEVDRIGGLGERLGELLAGAPRVRCFCTSRLPLSVSGESIVTLHGLEVPTEGAAVETLGRFDAIRLLKVTERRADPGSTQREPEVHAMARVARLLEGFPLGLEMAGAWRGVFSWREIAERIAANLDFLVHTHRDVPARHRNLRAVYEQSWALLTEDERAALCRLAIFHGGFTVDAAERAAGSSTAVLSALARRCLIRRVEPERYQVHQLVRQFSLENLHATAGRFETAVERHATYYIDWTEEVFEQLKGAEQLGALRALKRDLANVLSAWRYAAASDRPDLLRRAAQGLFFYFDMRAHFEDGARAFRAVIEALREGLDPAVDGLLRVAHGWFAQFSADAEPGRWIEEGLARLDAVEPFSADHAIANVIAAYAGRFDALEEVRARLDASIAHYQASGDPWGEALAVAALAGCAFSMDREEGVRLAERSLRLRRRIGDHWGEALNLSTLGGFAEAQEKWDLAKLRYHQSQRLASRIAVDLFMAVAAQLSRARIATYQGAYEEARGLAEGALELARAASNRLLTSTALRELGREAKAQGEAGEATRYLEEAFSLLEGTPWRAQAARCAALLGELAAEAGDAAGARGWADEARALDPDCTGTDWSP